MSTFVKDPDHSTEYDVDVRVDVTTPAKRGHPYDAGDLVRASNLHTGFYYECTTAGETGSGHVRWPRASGETVRDGSVLWTCRAPSEASLPTIDEVEWTADSGITVASSREDDGIAYVTLSGGTAGEDYDVTARITWSTGQIEEQTITIQVRNQ